MLTKKNPVLTGFHPDPSICRVGEDYFIATSTFQWFPGVELYHSRDLVNWESLPSPLNRVSQLDMAGNPNSGGVWAPCLSYSEGLFYLIYTNVKNFHGIFKDTHNYLVTTDDIYSGNWSEPVYLNSSGFDPSLFHDDNGKKYLVNMRWDPRMENHAFSGILLQEYSEKEKRLVGPVVNIFKGTEIGATEAPHLYKKDGYYYLMVAEGGTMYWHGVRLARSKDLFGPYEADPIPLLTVRDRPDYYLQRTGHASLINTMNGAWYVAYLCGRPVGEKRRCILGRETCISEVVWKDGWLRLKNFDTAPPLEYSSDLPEHKYEKQDSTVHFDNDKLPDGFKTLRVPFDEKIGSLTQRKGFLRLYGRESVTSWNRQALVGRRLQHFRTVSTVKMEFSPVDFQQTAGLEVIYDTYNFYYLYMSKDEQKGNVLRIIVRDNLKFTNPLMTGVSIGDSTAVWLRVEIDHLFLQFKYSLNGEEFIDIGEKMDCSDLSDEAYFDIGHEGHTGTFIAMSCQDLSCGESENRCHADFESFTYEVL